MPRISKRKRSRIENLHGKRQKPSESSAPSSSTPAAPSTKSNDRNTFLNLPSKIRADIFRYVLDDILSEPQHPYDELPYLANSRISSSLRNITQQARKEVQQLLDTEYMSRMTMYCEDIPTLFTLQAAVEENPALQNARFYLRCSSSDVSPFTGIPGERRKDVEDVIERQIGHKHAWKPMPWGPSSEHYVRDPYVRDPRVLRRMQEEAAQASANKQWPLVVRQASHIECQGRDTDQCIPYTEIRYPPLDNSLRLRGFLWGERKADPDRPGKFKMEKVGCLVLEGKLADVDLTQYDLLFGYAIVAVHDLGQRLKLLLKQNGGDLSHAEVQTIMDKLMPDVIKKAKQEALEDVDVSEEPEPGETVGDALLGSLFSSAGNGDDGEESNSEDDDEEGGMFDPAMLALALKLKSS